MANTMYYVNFLLIEIFQVSVVGTQVTSGQVVRACTLNDGTCVELRDRALNGKNLQDRPWFWICRKARILNTRQPVPRFPSLLFSLHLLLYRLFLDVWADFSGHKHALSTATNRTTLPRVMPSKVISGRGLVSARRPSSVLIWHYDFYYSTVMCVIVAIIRIISRHEIAVWVRIHCGNRSGGEVAHQQSSSSTTKVPWSSQGTLIHLNDR